MTKTPDLLPCPSKEARELLAAEYEADHPLTAAAIRSGERDRAFGLDCIFRAIEKALSRPFPVSDEEVERVARAIAEAADADPERWYIFIDEARAAIAAIVSVGGGLDE